MDRLYFKNTRLKESIEEFKRAAAPRTTRRAGRIANSSRRGRIRARRRGRLAFNIQQNPHSQHNRGLAVPDPAF